MNDTGNIRFDTTNVRGFAEYMHHLLTTKYGPRVEEIKAKLNGGSAPGVTGDLAAGSANGSMGTSGVEYYGREIGNAEVENAQAGAAALDDLMLAWLSMANGAAYVAEEYSGQDADNADELGNDIKSGDEVL